MLLFTQDFIKTRNMVMELTHNCFFTLSLENTRILVLFLTFLGLNRNEDANINHREAPLQ